MDMPLRLLNILVIVYAFGLCKRWFPQADWLAKSSRSSIPSGTYVADGATFFAQSAALADITTVKAYCDWMAAFGDVTAPGATYELHSSSYDPATKTAVFFDTYYAKHTGDGGPVPPTNRETHSHYVYILTMNDEQTVAKMVKVWNDSWAMSELGWS